MVVGRDYMLRKPSGPGRPKVFLDTRVVPWVVNIAGAAEVGLSRASARSGLRPAVIVAGLAAAVIVAGVRLRHRRVETRG